MLSHLASADNRAGQFSGDVYIACFAVADHFGDLTESAESVFKSLGAELNFNPILFIFYVGLAIKLGEHFDFEGVLTYRCV